MVQPMVASFSVHFLHVLYREEGTNLLADWKKLQWMFKTHMKKT